MVWSPSFFWFDPDGGGNRLEARYFTIVEGEVPFFLNALWAALEPLGKLILVTALAGAAAALFSPGIAFGLTLAVYVCASAHPFLQDVLSAFADGSVLDLLGHAEAGHRAHSHVWLEKILDRFQTALQGFLDFWLMVVPDFGRFRGGRLLAEGHAIRPGELLHSFVTGGGYAASFFLLAFPFLLRQEVRR